MIDIGGTGRQRVKKKSRDEWPGFNKVEMQVTILNFREFNNGGLSSFGLFELDQEILIFISVVMYSYGV